VHAACAEQDPSEKMSSECAKHHALRQRMNPASLSHTAAQVDSTAAPAQQHMHISVTLHLPCPSQPLKTDSSTVRLTAALCAWQQHVPHTYCAHLEGLDQGMQHQQQAVVPLNCLVQDKCTRISCTEA
jgi:hypothetical protein